MASLSARAASRAAAIVGALALVACSPEATRRRDDGPGADPGNKPLVLRVEPVPRAADTTLWPGRAPAPVDLLARGEMPPPAVPSPATAPPRTNQNAVTPNVPPSASEHRTFDKGGRANPRKPSSPRP